MKSLCIIYADSDAARAEKVISVLKSEGFVAHACTGIPAPLPDGFGQPDCVILREEISAALQVIVETLWPAVPLRSLGDGEDYSQVTKEIRAALAAPSDPSDPSE
jgi:hypothetical protein